MAIRLSTTKKEGSEHGVKVLCYGMPGVGKTYMIRTAPNPLIISNEAGLMSLQDVTIPVIVVEDYDSLLEAYQFVETSQEMEKFDTIALDSISEIAELILAHEKRQVTDVRQAYGELQLKTIGLCRAFRNIKGKHVYMSAKQERTQNENNVFVNMLNLPGQRLKQDLPYIFDEIFCLRAETNDTGELVRTLQTQPTFTHVCKDRSGKLDIYEPPNLQIIFNKISSEE